MNKDVLKHSFYAYMIILSISIMLSFTGFVTGGLGRVVNMLLISNITTYIILIFSHKIAFKTYNINFSSNSFFDIAFYTKIGFILIILGSIGLITNSDGETLEAMRRRTLVFNNTEVLNYYTFKDFMKPYMKLIAYVGSMLNYLNLTFLLIFYAELVFPVYNLKLLYRINGNNISNKEITLKASTSKLFKLRKENDIKFISFPCLSMYILTPILISAYFYYPFICLIAVIACGISSFYNTWKIYSEIENYNPKRKIKQKEKAKKNIFEPVGD